jgi:hypothetical protein
LTLESLALDRVIIVHGASDRFSKNQAIELLAVLKRRNWTNTTTECD